MAAAVDAATLKSWLRDGGELAILDAREEGEFGASHLFWAVPCPLSQAEIRAPHLLPRLSVRRRSPAAARSHRFRARAGSLSTKLEMRIPRSASIAV